MKKLIKYALLIIAITTMLFSCEKDVDNTIPADEAKVENDHRKFRTVFTETVQDKKIWISNLLSFRSQYNFALGRWGSIPFFVAMKPGEEDNISIYVNTRHADYQKKSKDKDGLLNNPNIYKIDGDFHMYLSVSTAGVLSSLKTEEVFDFDFLVRDFNPDSITLKSLYRNNSNRITVFKPYDFNNNIKNFFKSSQILFPIGKFSTYNNISFLSSWSAGATIELFSKEEPKKPKFTISPKDDDFSNALESFYDKKNKLFVFKTLNEFNGKDTIKLSRSGQLFSHVFSNFKYAEPIKVTDTEITFRTYGKTNDKDKNNGEYILAIKKK